MASSMSGSSKNTQKKSVHAYQKAPEKTHPPVVHGNVLQVLPALDSGGVERGTADIAQALVEQGYGSFVASAGGAMVPWLERKGTVHITVPLTDKSPLAIWRNAAQLTRIIKKHKIGVVHARSRAPAWSARLAAKRCGVPLVTTFHGHYSLKAPFKRWYNSIMTKGDTVIAISEFTADHIRTSYPIDEQRLVVIPRGVDLSQFSAATVNRNRIIQLATEWRLPEDKPIVFMPGRFTRWKGQHVLIEALSMLEGADICCVFAGSDDGHPNYRKELEKQVMELDLGRYVRFVEPTRDMPAAYMVSNVVVCPSIRPEAFGRIPVEAGAMGRPVIAAKHGGAMETVQDGKTGWLVEPESPIMLAEALAEALNMDDAARSAMADAARRYVKKHFDLAKMRSNTLAVYDSMIKKDAQ